VIPPPPYQVPTTFGFQQSLNPNIGFALLNPNLRTPYDQQFAASIQHEFRGTIIEVRYIGSHGTKLLRSFDINQINVKQNGFLGDFLKAQQNAALALASNPRGGYNPAYQPRLPGSQPLPVFSQLFAGGSLSDPTYRALIQNGEVAELAYEYTLNGENGNLNFFPNPNTLAAYYLDNFSNSSYNSGQIEARRRLQGGLEFQVNYVFSKLLSDAAGLDNFRFEPFLDINNGAIERARTPNDLRHQFKANYSYELPWGEGHALHLKGIGNRAISGWTTSGNLSWTSGNPFSIYSGYGTFQPESYSGTNEANTLLTRSQLDGMLQLRMTPDGPYIVPASAIGADGRGVAPAGQAPFNGQIFSNPGPATVGTLQRRQFTGPAVFNMDAALFKDTKITERLGVQLRMEALNVFNHPAFAAFSTSINSSQFGRVTSTATAPRTLQFGLRVSF
jgi:hypothetical protein